MARVIDSDAAREADPADQPATDPAGAERRTSTAQTGEAAARRPRREVRRSPAANAVVTNAVVTNAMVGLFDPAEFLGLRRIQEIAFGVNKAMQAAVTPHLVAQQQMANWVIPPVDIWPRPVLPRFTLPEFHLPELHLPQFTDWWPAGSLMTSVMRPIDVLQPALPDLSHLLDNVLNVTRWLGWPGDELWRDGLWTEMRRVGRWAIYWAVQRAYAAMRDGELDELAEFLRDWLDYTPTEPRVEATVEALLQLELTGALHAYHPTSGDHDTRELLDHLRALVRAAARRTRREHGMLLGLRRGTGTIAELLAPDRAGLHPAGTLPERPLEETVLDALQPDSDPQLIELVKALPREDLKIVLLKAATGCAWAAAATACGQPARRGEAVRRRLQRQRAALATTSTSVGGTDLGSRPGWADPAGVRIAPGERSQYGRLPGEFSTLVEGLGRFHRFEQISDD